MSLPLNQDLPTFDGQALGGDYDAWAAKLRELATAARNALQNDQDTIFQAARQALEAYAAFPCPDNELRTQANQLLDDLTLSNLEKLLKQLHNLKPPVGAAPLIALKVAAAQQAITLPTPRQRLLNTFYALQALQKQHTETPFKHARHRSVGRQLQALLTTTQALLEQ